MGVYVPYEKIVASIQGKHRLAHVSHIDNVPEEECKEYFYSSYYLCWIVKIVLLHKTTHLWSFYDPRHFFFHTVKTGSGNLWFPVTPVVFVLWVQFKKLFVQLV